MFWQCHILEILGSCRTFGRTKYHHKTVGRERKTRGKETKNKKNKMRRTREKANKNKMNRTRRICI